MSTLTCTTFTVILPAPYIYTDFCGSHTLLRTSFTLPPLTLPLSLTDILRHHLTLPHTHSLLDVSVGSTQLHLHLRVLLPGRLKESAELIVRESPVSVDIRFLEQLLCMLGGGGGGITVTQGRETALGYIYIYTGTHNNVETHLHDYKYKRAANIVHAAYKSVK